MKRGRRPGVLVLLIPVVCLLVIPWTAGAYESPGVVRERLEKFLPRTFAKLKSRQSVHLLAVGDSVTHSHWYGDLRHSALPSYYGVFASELAKEFFLTGGVREVRPVEGNPEKLAESHGPEITVEQRAKGGADIFYGFSALTTDGFDNDPDLVTIMFGINDSVRHLSLSSFAAAADAQVELVKAKGSDVILIGPTPAILSEDARAEISLTRPYADVLKGVALKHGVFYADGGQLMLSQVAAPSELKPGETIQQLVEALEPFFDHGPDIKDMVHPNRKGHEALGRALAKALLYGEFDSQIGVIGVATETGGGSMRVDVELENRREDMVEGVICPLAVSTDAVPVGGASSEQAITLEPGAKQRLAIRLEEAGAGQAGVENRWLARGVIFGYDEFVRLPMVLATRKGFQFLDARAIVKPFAILWDIGGSLNVDGKLRIGATLRNTSGAALEGTYVGTWNGQRVSGNISAAGGELVELPLAFDFPQAPASRLKRRVVLEVEVGGVKVTYSRGVEISQNFGLGQRMDLFPLSLYTAQSTYGEQVSEDGARVTMRADADANALFLTFDIEGHEFQSTAVNPAMSARLNFDGRYFEERGESRGEGMDGLRAKIGYTGPIQIKANLGDGPAAVEIRRYATFGNGYDRPLDAKNIRAELTTKADGSRRLNVGIPRAYFYKHEWALGNGNSSLGINADVSLLRVDEDHPTGYYPAELHFVLARPDMMPDDIRSLSVLELQKEPTKRWSVRVY